MDAIGIILISMAVICFCAGVLGYISYKKERQCQKLIDIEKHQYEEFERLKKIGGKMTIILPSISDGSREEIISKLSKYNSTDITLAYLKTIFENGKDASREVIETALEVWLKQKVTDRNLYLNSENKKRIFYNSDTLNGYIIGIETDDPIDEVNDEDEDINIWDIISKAGGRPTHIITSAINLFVSAEFCIEADSFSKVEEFNERGANIPIMKEWEFYDWLQEKAIKDLLEKK